MYKYISQDKPNRVRQPELDLSKFFAIILMIMCHVGIHFCDSDTVEYVIFDMAGGEFAAPVFMVCMGVGIVFSHHNQPAMLIKRGFNIFILGYALNVVRVTIPGIIVTLINPDVDIISIPASIYEVDILQFAGLAMMLLGLLKKWKVEPAYQAMIGILMAGLGDILGWVSTGHEWLDAICDLIWGANEWSFFPLLNWFIYPAAGVLFGEILMHCNNRRELYKRLLPIGFVGVAISYYLLFTEGDSYYSNYSYYFMGIKNVVYGLCYPMFAFSICYFISIKTKIADCRLVTYSSKNLIVIYCTSWIAICWTKAFDVLLFGWQLNALTFTLLMIAIFAVSYGLCQIWLNIRKKKPV